MCSLATSISYCNRRSQIWLKVGFMVALLLCSSAHSQANPPIPSWIVKGMEATLTLQMPTHSGVIAQALRFPLAVDIIVAIEPSHRAAIASQLLALLNDQTIPPD